MNGLTSLLDKVNIKMQSKSSEINFYEIFSIIFKIIIILILMYAIIKIGSKIIDKTIKRNQNMFSVDIKKAKTLNAILKSILRYSVYFCGIMSIFGTISITAASIGGVTVGLGAQNLIKDVINGVFILVENQYSVGDNVTIENKNGIVESLELRITKIRDFNGDLHIIPNGSIKNVTNHSRGNLRIAVKVCIDYSESVDKVFSIINSACSEFTKKHKKDIIDSPKVLGMTSIGLDGMDIMITGKSSSAMQGQNEMDLRKIILDELLKNNIKLANNRLGQI